MDKKEKIFFCSNIFFVLALLSAIYVFDILIYSDISSRVSIAANQLGSPTNFDGIGISFFIFGAFVITSNLLLALSPFIKKYDLNSFFITWLVLSSIVTIIREALVFSYITCFNFYITSFPVARASLSFVLVCTIFLIIWKQTQEIRNSDKIYPISIKILIIFSSTIFILTTIGLNIVLLTQLRWDNRIDITSKNIKIGFFNPSEQLAIKSGTYIKDQYFDNRLVGSLNDIIKSNNKTLVKKICTKRCSYFYRRQYSFNIECNNITKEFYNDCNLATSLSIKLQYTDKRGYPVYSCARKNENMCFSTQCPELENLQYRLMLIQLNQDNKKVEPAWKGLCKCGNKQPDVLLKYDEGLNACYCCSNSSRMVFSWIFLLFILGYSIYF